MKFRIMEYDGFGFVAQEYDPVIDGWAAITKDLTLGVIGLSVLSYPRRYANKSEKEAGELINRRCHALEQKPIWTGSI